MTWDEFVAEVERQFQEKGFDRKLPIEWIDWQRLAFGGPEPEIYVQQHRGALMIGED